MTTLVNNSMMFLITCYPFLLCCHCMIIAYSIYIGMVEVAPYLLHVFLLAWLQFRGDIRHGEGEKSLVYNQYHVHIYFAVYPCKHGVFFK